MPLPRPISTVIAAAMPRTEVSSSAGRCNHPSPGKFSFVLRGYVRKWCSEIDAEVARVKLIQDLLSGGRAPQTGLQD